MSDEVWSSSLFQPEAGVRGGRGGGVPETKYALPKSPVKLLILQIRKSGSWFVDAKCYFSFRGTLFFKWSTLGLAAQADLLTFVTF